MAGGTGLAHPRRCDADERAARHLPAAMIPVVAQGREGGKEEEPYHP